MDAEITSFDKRGKVILPEHYGKRDPYDLPSAGVSRRDSKRLESSKDDGGFPTLSEAQRRLALWREHYNHQRSHSALDNRAPAVFAALHQPRTARSALSDADKTNGKPRQGSAAPADAALDPARRLSEDTYDQGEALSRIARTRDSLLSLWSEFQARQTGFAGP